MAISQSIGAKSYTSLHTLVNDMFLPTSLAKQVPNHLIHLFVKFELNPEYFLLLISEHYSRITTHGIIGECHCQVLTNFSVLSYSLPFDKDPLVRNNSPCQTKIQTNPPI